MSIFDKYDDLPNFATEQISMLAKRVDSLSAELASYKADAIRLLGEKVKAKKERDRAVSALKDAAADIEQYANESCAAEYKRIIAEIERG